MHPPIAEPDVKIYIARFTPAVGDSAIFRHKEHSTTYGLKCVNCHRHDNCASCHSATPQAAGPRPVRPGRSWEESHKPCISCHQQDRCRTCHYDSSDEQPPAPFQHAMTGQLLDRDHAHLKCGQCHSVLKARKVVTCGDSSCHRPRQRISFPRRRPGPLVTTDALVQAPTSRPVVEVLEGPTGTIKRVRRAP
jgi:hypothetical protein